MERNIVHLLMGAFSSGHPILWTLTYLSEKVEMSREDAVQETEASADKVEDMVCDGSQLCHSPAKSLSGSLTHILLVSIPVKWKQQ